MISLEVLYGFGAIVAIGFVGPGLGGHHFALLALAYPLLILSFLGGTWWGLSTRTPTSRATTAAAP